MVLRSFLAKGAGDVTNTRPTVAKDPPPNVGGNLRLPPGYGYAMAIALTAVAVWLRVALTPLIGDNVPFSTIFIAVVLTAWFGGVGPCLVAVALGALGSWYFVLQPRHSLLFSEPFQPIGLASFVCAGLVLAAFSGRARSAIAEMDKARRLSEKRWIDAEHVKQALEESERRFRGFAEHTQDVLWITRGDRPELVYVNPAFNLVYGRPPDEILSDFSRIADYVHEDDRARARTFWQRCGDGALVEDYRIVRPDGSTAWIRRRGFRIPGANGEIAYRAAISEDITKEKRIQEERDRLLESERMARQVAERNSRIKDEFLSTLSHELRSPLNAILGWVRVLKGPSLNGQEVAQALEAIDRNSRSQGRLIDDLLDMSRIVSGKLRLEVQTVDLAPIVKATVESVLPAADAKRIVIEQILDPLAGPVRGDPDRLQQIVWNLLSNAIKFTSRGGLVQVHLRRATSHCEISVSDTGRGIAPEFLPFVFDRFRQQDASTTRTEAGLGLGLAIVKQLVEHHGGSVAVNSVGEGCGATFIVRLPVSVAAYPISDPDFSRQGWDGGASLAGVHALVVEDDPDACHVLRRILEEHHVTVSTASSAASALAQIEKGPPDILLSDIGMPGGDGYGLIAAVRALQEPARRVPAIAVTAFARPEDRIRALRAGFDMHLAKPIDIVELLTIMTRLTRDR
jgi:PAS domain S-box-containing protein